MNFIDTGLDFDDGNFERRLAALPVPPMPANLAARCRGLVAAGAVPVSARRRSSRVVLLGAAVIVAAAAAVLVRKSDLPPAAAAVGPVPVPQDAGLAQDQRVVPSVESPAAVKPVSSVGSPAIAKVPTPFTVKVLPLKNEARNAEARSSIELFHATFLRGLRDIPGLTLITPESTGVAEGTEAPYQLEFSGSDDTSPGKWIMRINAKALVAGSTASTFMTLPILILGEEGDPASVAVAQLELARNILFPQDPGRKQQLQSRLLDRTLDPSVRLQALTDLRLPRLVAPEDGRPGRIQKAPLEDAVIPGAVDLATASDEKMRASAWQVLRGAGNPSLVAPLAQAARHDQSEEVRLLAVTMLSEDFAADPAAAAALKVAATDEPRQLVRMVAQKAIAGGAAGDDLWRDYVRATLGDASLDAAERLAPLRYMSESGQRLTGVLDDEAWQSIAPLVRPMWAGDARLARLGRSLIDDAQTNSNPVVIDLCVEALRVAANPYTRTAALHTLATKFRDDERARKALESAAASDPDPGVRQKAAEALR